MQTLLIAVVILFPVSEILIAIRTPANSRTARIEDRGSMALLWTVITASVAMSIGFQWIPAARIHAPGSLCLILALIIMLIGLAVRWTAIYTLGHFFSANVAIHAGHTVVQTGLYKYIRHPSYTVLLIAFLGLGIYFANWLSIIALVVPISLALVNRIVKEEKALHEALGVSYADYCARTKRLIPGLL